MKDIIFARTRHHYDSYTDFWRLVALSGFPTIYVDEIDHTIAATYITTPFNGEHLTIPRNRRNKILLWNLERPGERSVEAYRQGNDHHIQDGHIDGVIVSDAHLAAHTGFKYVPMGSHPELGAPAAREEKVWDYIHLMCYSLRRSQFFNYLTPKKKYHGMLIAPNGWGEDRHRHLRQSKFMLSIHQDKHPYIEPLRIALAAAYSLPVLMEYASPLSSEFYFGGIFVMAQGISNYELPMKNVLSKYDSVGYDVGQVLHKRLTEEFTFKKCLEQYL